MPDSPVRITPFLQDIEDLAAAGADIIAVDGTDRPRPIDLKQAVAKIHELGCLRHGRLFKFGRRIVLPKIRFDIIGSTMSGYTGKRSA